MQDTKFRPDPGPDRSLSLRAEMAQHTVIENLPAHVRSTIATFGILGNAASGAQISAGKDVLFILSGALGAAADAHSAVALDVPAGGVWGLELLFSDVPPLALRAIVNSRWIAVPAARLLDEREQTFWERMYAHQAVGRVASLSAEVSCAARHPVIGRTAKWLNRLASRQTGKVVTINQSELAAVLCVQRTTINAAFSVLRKAGALRCRRGAIEVLNVHRLRSFACACASREWGRPTFADDGYVVLTPRSGSGVFPADMATRFNEVTETKRNAG